MGLINHGTIDIATEPAEGKGLSQINEPSSNAQGGHGAIRVFGRAFGVVLAGGAGRRLGGADKARLEVGGQQMLARAFAALAPAARVAVAGGRRIRPADLPERVVLADPRPDRGPLGGIAAALAWAEAGGAQWLLTAPVDAPFLKPAIYEALLADMADSPDAAAAIAVADGRDQWLAAVLRPSLALSARKTLDTPDLAVARFLEGHGARRVPINNASDAFLNVNTPSDLAAAKRLAAREGA